MGAVLQGGQMRVWGLRGGHGERGEEGRVGVQTLEGLGC